MVALIGTGAPAMAWVREAVDAALTRGQHATAGGRTVLYRPEDITLLAPVPRPPGIANFSCWPAHGAAGAARGSPLRPAEEGSGILPYWKGNPDSVVDPDAVLEPPPYEAELDVECELVCVVGTGGRDLISAGCYHGGCGKDLDRTFRPGDVVELRISRIGALVNRIGGGR
jgi:2-keto-4-pentenoate hydratase/2-oxohepta-3-ene-1,7-dioic acid hydratase in catechol pathway